jgi:hypothetical protein
MNALSATPGSFFTLAISHRPISDILAKFAYDILQVFEKKEIYLVDSTLYFNSNAVVNTSASISSPAIQCCETASSFYLFFGISGLGFVPVYILLLK